jgi:hypothetical protein
VFHIWKRRFSAKNVSDLKCRGTTSVGWFEASLSIPERGRECYFVLSQVQASTALRALTVAKDGRCLVHPMGIINSQLNFPRWLFTSRIKEHSIPLSIAWLLQKFQRHRKMASDSNSVKPDTVEPPYPISSRVYTMETHLGHGIERSPTVLWKLAYQKKRG